MQTANTFLDTGWDFINETENGSNNIWKISEGQDYPRLWWESHGKIPIPEPFPWEGDGTNDSPFLIYTAEELNMMGLFWTSWHKNFKLMADIDLSGFDGQEGRPIFNIIAPDILASTPEFQGVHFSGVFDGNGHAISHLMIEGGSYLGLFGMLVSEAKVKNLGVVDVNITGSGDYVGGLVGQNYGGTVTDCYSTGTVSGNDNVGGLIGRTYGMLVGSWASVDVSGDFYVGGLAGSTHGNISNCYAKGNTLGRWYVGGLVGFNYSAVIQDCYAIGRSHGDSRVGGLIGRNFKGKILACFWDKDTSGLMNMCDNEGDEAAGCDDKYGKTTAEMKTAATFIEAGWDFVDETANSTEDIWWILEGQDYPRLWWELIEDTPIP